MMSEETEGLSPNITRAQKKKKVERNQSVKGRSRKKLQPSNLQGLQNEDLVQLLCVLEAEVQAKDIIISAIMKGEIGSALPLSHLLDDAQFAAVSKPQDIQGNDDDDDIWLGEPTAHLNHVVAYHQLVREQMQSMMQSLQDQHKMVLRQLEDEQQKHAIDTAQGDEVTYMLEKERERLTNEIEFEQGKVLKAEKERDKLLMTLEKERETHMTDFHLLLNDCKTFAKQLVEQAQKEDQLIKEIEQEKRKNRVLSELMVEEQKKFKERIRIMEEERDEYLTLLRQKQEREMRLDESENRTRDAHQMYIHESQKSEILKLEREEFTAEASSKDSSESSTNDDDLINGEVTFMNVMSSEARKVQPLKELIQEDNEAYVVIKDYEITKKSNITKPNRGSVSKTKPVTPEKTMRASQTSTIKSAVNNEMQRPNAANDDFKNKKIPPPTPPRISSITAKSVPILSSDPDGNFDVRGSQFVRSNSLGADTFRHRSQIDPGIRPETRQAKGSSGTCSLVVAVVTDYGWEYTKEEGLVQSNRVLDPLGTISVYPESSWITATESVNKLLIEKLASRVWKDSQQQTLGLTLSSIQSYEFRHHLWRHSEYPLEARPWETCCSVPENEHSLLTVRLKDETTSSFDSLAYSTSIPVNSLQEYCRLIQKYRNVLFLADDILEAKHFISCFSNWLKITDELRQRTSFVASVEETEICSSSDLIKLLIDYGALVCYNQIREKHTTIVLIDVDFAVSKNFALEIFSWLGSRGSGESFYITNSMDYSNQPYFLQEDVIVLAYGTRSNLQNMSQGMYRIFKFIDLPPLMSYLLQKWLRQKASQHHINELNFKQLDEWVTWISDVYRRTRTDLERLDIQLDMPDIGLFLSAPMDQATDLTSWAEDLWTQHFRSIITRSVEQQAIDASKDQQELLMQVAMKTFFENALLPGCPVRLEI